MICKMQKIWYCEYCGKRYFRNSPKHEKYCTMNPDRECRMCKVKRDYRELETSARMLMLLTPKDEEFDVGKVESMVECCPACTLTLVRMIQRRCEDRFLGAFFHWDYRERCTWWWEWQQEKNDV